MKKLRSTGKTKPAAKKQISKKGNARKKRLSSSKEKGTPSQAKDFNGKGDPESEEYYRTLTDNTPVMIWITRPDGGCTYLNKQWYDYTGQTSERALGFGWLSAVHPDDATMSERIFLNANYKQIPFNLVYRLRNSKGEYRWHMDSGLPKFNAKGEYEGFIGSVIDTHETVLATQKIEESEANYRTLFNSIDDGFCTIEVLFDDNDKPCDYRFLEVNKAFEQQTGLTNALGKTMNDFAQIEDFWYQTYGKVAVTGEAIRFENRAENLHRFYDVYAFKTGAQHERKVAVLFTDITERKVTELALQESEQHFRALVNATSNVVYRMNADWSEMRNLEGRGFLSDTEEPIKDWLQKYVQPGDHQRVLDIIDEAIQAKSIFELEHQVKLADGAIGWTVSRAIPILDPKGNILEWFGAASDVTERKRMEQSLIENEKQLQNIFRQAPFALAVLEGPEHRYVIGNPAYQKIVNRKEKDFIGKTLIEVFPEIDGQGPPEYFDTVYKTGESFSANEFPLKLDALNDGELQQRYYSFSIEPLKNGEGKVHAVVLLGIDVTESVEARKKIEETKQLYETITQNTPDLIYVFDLNYRFRYANEALLAMWGKSLKDSIGKGLRQLGYEEWHAVMHEREIDQVIATKNSIRGTVSFPHAELGKRIYDYIFAPILNERNEVIAIAGTTRDISDIKKSEEIVKESEAQLSFAIAAAELGVWDYNPLTNKFRANDRLKQWFGLGPKDEIDLSLAISVIAEKDRARVSEAIQKALQWGSNDYNIEYSIINPQTSQERIVRAKGKAAFNDDKVAYRFNGTLQDVTEQAQARKKIEESDAFNRSVLESSPDCVKVIDTNGRLQFMNINGMCIMEIDDFTSFKNKMWSELWGAENRHYVLDALNKALSGKTAQFQAFCPTAKGTPKWWDVMVSPVQQPGSEKVMSLISVSRDITQQMEAHKKIEESEKNFRQLADLMPGMTNTADSTGNVNFYSNNWVDFTGISLKELHKEGWGNLLHPDDAEAVAHRWQKSVETGNNFEMEFRIRGKDNQYKWQLSRATALKDDDGKVLKWLGTMAEIQTQKELSEVLEVAVEERTAELYEKNIELQKMNKELESFNYISSHDLQEPLRKIQTFSTRLMEKENQNLSVIGKDYFIRIQESAQRMQTLIQDLLAFSRVSTSERKFELTDLRVIVEEVWSEFRELLETKNATLEVGKLCELNIVPFQFRQLFQNLIGNVLKFSKPDIQPQIEIASETIKGSDQKDFEHKDLSPGTTYCHITFTDNGIGFEQHFSEQIFQVFQKLHGRDKFPGTGIGLAIVKKIVDNHNGIIKASGELGRGARFDIYIPVY